MERTKLDKAWEILALVKLANKLSEEATDAIATAKRTETIEDVVAARLKTSELLLVQQEAKEKMDQWQVGK